jgi:hypothetical protein
MPAHWWGVITESTVPALAGSILDPKRRQPIIVVTTSTYTTPARIPPESLAEAEHLREEVGDFADVALVATGDVSFALESLLPEHWHIFNGFCRSYPSDILQNPDIRRSPLRRRTRDEVASERVINDAFGQAQLAGVFARMPTGSIATTGEVKGFLLDGERALVDAGAQWPAVILGDMTAPGVPLDWLIGIGTEVPGDLDRDHNRFLLRKSAFGAAEFESAFPHEAVTLALVTKVKDRHAVLQVHPDLSIRVDRTEITSNPHDMLDLFLVEGEVVRARVVHLSTGKPHLRLNDVDDDEPVLPAVRVVEGGTPWLLEGRNLPAAAEHASIMDSTQEADAEGAAPDEPTGADVTDAGPVPDRLVRHPTPGPGLRLAAPPEATVEPSASRGAVHDMSIKITALSSDNERLRQEASAADGLRQDLDLMRRTLRDVKVELGETKERLVNFQRVHKAAVEELRRARKRQPPPARSLGPRDRRDAWPTDESWLRNEIRLAWVERVQAAEKAAFALPDDYTIGPRFADSLAPLDDNQFDKAMKTVVDALTDRAKDIPGRDLHRLRTGDGGGDDYVVRPEDGAQCWRAAIEINSPSARRLHYWTASGRVELSRIVLHDDMEP